ncbi:MAG: molybdopterin cofactor-binding domain-containing protein [Pyrinomonadaceae bacterium]
MQQQAPAKKKKKVKVTKVVDGIDTVVEIEVDDDDGVGPKWGPNDKHTLLNKRIRRVDAPLKVAGVAQYSYDMRLPGMLFGRILRSPHAHARVVKFDASAALKIPGVRAVADERPPAKEGETLPWELRYQGQPVAGLAATTSEIADDAVRALIVEYEVLPHVVTPEDAMKADAPQVLLKDPNVEPNSKQGDPAKVEAAMKEADVVVEGDYRSPIIHHASLETHGMVVDYRGGNEATIYASTQGTFTIPEDSAKELGLPLGAVTAVVEHMGGGFGSKFGIGVEGRLACRLSKETKAPVKMMLTRQDEFVTAGNRSGSWQTLKAGARKDGTIVAFQAIQRKLGGLGDGSQAGQPYIYSAEFLPRSDGDSYQRRFFAGDARSGPPAGFVCDRVFA